MAGLGGLLSGVMKGFGAGLEQVGQVELKKQSELDLRKQMMEIESEKRLREDEVRRERDIAQIPKEATARAEAKVTTAPIEAKAIVAGESATLEARKTAELDRKQAEAAASKRVEELKAIKEKGVAGLEAEVAAMTEAAKYDALIKAKVPEAKARALLAEYEAAGPQRQKELNDQIAASIKKEKDVVTTLAKDKEYTRGLSTIDVAKSAGSIAEIREREKAYKDRTDGKGGAETTKDLERQQQAAAERLAYELSVPKNKVNEEIGSLRKKAERGDKAAADKLRNLGAYLTDWESANTKLREWQRSPKKDSGEAAPAKTTGEKRPIESFNR
jgi:hypothetical protein